MVPIDRSPCLDCPNNDAGIDKKLCLGQCERLKAYQLGQDYTGMKFFAVPEGKDLVEDIENDELDAGFTGTVDVDRIDLEFEETDDESKEIEADPGKSPGPVTHIPPETSWKKHLTRQGGGHKSVANSKNICVICGKTEGDDNRFLRGICRNPCYSRWYRGIIEHPVLGKFKTAPWAPKEIVSVEKKIDPPHEQRHKTDRPTVTDDISLTTININLELYPQIRDAVYRLAVSLSLPVSHVAVTLLAEALESRRAAKG